jgi:septal ring factor EnvC (AmiA/AmiB activator)
VTNTTPSPDAGDTSNEPQDNWEGRYAGLQKVLAKRDSELTTTAAELDNLRKEREQAQAELDTYRQRTVDASEEEQARQSYEALRARFEQAPPTPVGNNPARSWADGSGDTNWRGRSHDGDGQGFPV